MMCEKCESTPCTCQALTKPKQQWLIQHCQTPGCDVAIRVKIETPLTHPICKWCDQGVSRAVNPKHWPDGMPDPELPWPWMTEVDRARKINTPFWQERFRRHEAIYNRFLKVVPA